MNMRTPIASSVNVPVHDIRAPHRIQAVEDEIKVIFLTHQMFEDGDERPFINLCVREEFR